MVLMRRSIREEGIQIGNVEAEAEATVVVLGLVRDWLARYRVRLASRYVALVVRYGLRGAARSLGISERTLRRRFREAGHPVRTVLLEFRRWGARELLESNWKTEWAASALGFKSAPAFRRFVNRNLGACLCTLRSRSMSFDIGRKSADLAAKVSTYKKRR